MKNCKCLDLEKVKDVILVDKLKNKEERKMEIKKELDVEKQSSIEELDTRYEKYVNDLCDLLEEKTKELIDILHTTLESVPLDDKNKKDFEDIINLLEKI